MAEYKLNIKVDPAWVTKYKSDKYKICLAFGFDTAAWPDSTKYNVIGYSSVRFDDATTPQPISSGQAWTLPPDWSEGTSSSDPDAPESGFLFLNETSSASAVIYKTVNGVETPVYVSHFGPLPAGKEFLTPRLQAAVWFQVAAETGAMIDNHETPIKVVDFTEATSHEIEYEASGVWKIVS
ncbi:hypothetical protein EsH8_X_000472 [Colletotrichum jinshuiense]